MTGYTDYRLIDQSGARKSPKILTLSPCPALINKPFFLGLLWEEKS